MMQLARASMVMVMVMMTMATAGHVMLVGVRVDVESDGSGVRLKLSEFPLKMGRVALPVSELLKPELELALELGWQLAPGVYDVRLNIVQMADVSGTIGLRQADDLGFGGNQPSGCRATAVVEVIVSVLILVVGLFESDGVMFGERPAHVGVAHECLAKVSDLVEGLSISEFPWNLILGRLRHPAIGTVRVVHLGDWPPRGFARSTVAR
jgi:hypothetical protein